MPGGKTKRPKKPRVSVTVTPRQRRLLDLLADQGVHGDTYTEVATSFVVDKLKELFGSAAAQDAWRVAASESPPKATEGDARRAGL